MDAETHCGKITVDEYEQHRLSLLANWWEDTFQKIGVDLRRKTEAKEIMESIPLYIMQTLKRILHIDDPDADSEKTHETGPKASTCHRTTYVEVPQSIPPGDPAQSQLRTANPYLAFFGRRNARIWREVVKATNFHDKAEALMKSIVEDFVSWANERLACDEIDEIKYEDISAMFQYDKSIINFLRSETVEVRCIPDDPLHPGAKASKSSRLRREILRDAKAYSRPKRTVAFGRCLPPELRSSPSRDASFMKFATYGDSRRMRSLEGVFSGRTNLTSIKNYCEFLKENHPEVPIPSIVTPDEVFEEEAHFGIRKSPAHFPRKSFFK